MFAATGEKRPARETREDLECALEGALEGRGFHGQTEIVVDLGLSEIKL